MADYTPVPLVATEFWSGLLAFILFFALVSIWAFVLTDLFMRKGMSGWAKALWIVAVVFFPFVGGLLYIITRRPTKAETAYYEQAVGDQATFISAAAGELERLQKLREKGEISEQEYQALRAHIVAGGGYQKAA